MRHVDVCIIGAGVLGCAIARELAKVRPSKGPTVVLEKGRSCGTEASSKNSGVLHSGFHQAPHSLKARFSKEGSKLAYGFARKVGVPVIDTGMLIAIPKNVSLWGLREEIPNFWHLLTRGRSNGIHFKFLTGTGVKRREPFVRASGGIFIPEVAVIDSSLFVKALECEAEFLGAEFLYGRTVVGVYQGRDEHLVVTSNGEEYLAKVLINAAGLYADEIANMALRERKYTIYPWRGEYYEIVGEKRELVQGLLYPVVPANCPGKGIHFGKRPDGRLFLGPNATLMKHKEEQGEKTPLRVFLEAGQRFLPELEESDLRFAYAGVRPKLSASHKEDDFIISVDSTRPALVSLVGIESPGLSSSLGIAKYVATLCDRVSR